MTPEDRRIDYLFPADAELELEVFHAARRNRRLLVPRCSECGKAHWYPRSFCPFCHCIKLGWDEAEGSGTVYSFSVMRRAKVPYAIAFVTLAEGPSMMTNIVGCAFEDIAIGMKLRLVFHATETGEPVAMFTPA